MKLTMIIELDIGEDTWSDPEEEADFRERILGDPEGLFLHSNEVGDVVGCVRVLEVKP